MSYSTNESLFQMDDDGVPDMDTMISILPDSMQERGGKMVRACNSVSEYRLTGKHTDFAVLFAPKKCKIWRSCQNEPVQNRSFGPSLKEIQDYICCWCGSSFKKMGPESLPLPEKLLKPNSENSV
jgi:hypothetical protein